MRIKLTVLAALLALCASSAYAATSVQNGQSTRGVQQLDLVGGIHSDSTGAVLTMSSTGSTITAEASPLNGSTNYGVGTSLMSSDTMSVNGRTMDSTAVFPCAAYGIITASFKMDGHHDAVGKIVRIAVIPIWSNSATASDTVLTTAGGFGLMVYGPGTSSATTFSPDSLGPTADATAHTSIPGVETLLRFLNRSIISENSLSYRTMTLSYRNPGYQYVRFITRVLSDTGTAATQGFQFKLSVTASGRAL